MIPTAHIVKFSDSLLLELKWNSTIQWDSKLQLCSLGLHSLLRQDSENYCWDSVTTFVIWSLSYSWRVGTTTWILVSLLLWTVVIWIGFSFEPGLLRIIVVISGILSYSLKVGTTTWILVSLLWTVCNLDWILFGARTLETYCCDLWNLELQLESWDYNWDSSVIIIVNYLWYLKS